LTINPENKISLENFSCASCHFASAGFQAGRFQGIGKSGMGFGRNGEGRIKGSLYPGSMINVQPIRSPSALNMAYQSAILWNGQFGATWPTFDRLLNSCRRLVSRVLWRHK